MSSTLPYNTDWSRLVAEVALAWPEPEFAHCHRLDELLDLIAGNPDAVLAALLRRTQAGDALAGRVVVQALLGKLVRMASRDPSAELDDYVAHLWCVLMRYPVSRRPGGIAGGLALDTLKAVVAERPAPIPGAVTRMDSDGVGADVVLARALSGGWISRVEHDLLHAVYVDGQTSAAVAAERGVTASAVRQSCRKALRRLAVHREQLAA